MGPPQASTREGIRAAPAQRPLIRGTRVDAGEETHEVRSRRVQPSPGCRGFQREAHHDVRGGERVARKPRPGVELLIQIIEMQCYLVVDVSARRSTEQAK